MDNHEYKVETCITRISHIKSDIEHIIEKLRRQDYETISHTVTTVNDSVIITAIGKRSR